MDEDAQNSPGPQPSEEPPAYEAPRIIWRERFEPTVFGISCAKEPGNPGCIPGPARL